MDGLCSLNWHNAGNAAWWAASIVCGLVYRRSVWPMHMMQIPLLCWWRTRTGEAILTHGAPVWCSREVAAHNTADERFLPLPRARNPNGTYNPFPPRSRFYL